MRAGLTATVVCEQLLEDWPGGAGVYVRALVDGLPRTGVVVDPVVARHRAADLRAAGLTQARRLRATRRKAYDRWAKGARRPGVGGDGDVVHSPVLPFPRPDGRPLVVTVHDLLHRASPEWFDDRDVALREASAERLEDADAVIVPSAATAESLRAAGLNPGPRLHVIPFGTDLRPPADDERDRVLERLEVERPYVLWVGAVVPRKNPEGVVRGFVHAVGDGVPRAGDLKLYLVGPPGWWSTEVGELLEERGLVDRVRRLGPQPRRVLAALYAGAEAFVFPSFGEGFALPVLEAMACGAPVVTSDRSSMPEVAGSAALLCDPADPESIGGCLAKLLRDRELADDLRRLGRARAAELTWDRMARATAACYRQVLAAR